MELLDLLTGIVPIIVNFETCRPSTLFQKYTAYKVTYVVYEVVMTG